MPPHDPVRLYERHYLEKQFERREFLEFLLEEFAIERCLYPGGFIHCTPSFYFPVTVYVDTDDRAARFFKSATTHRFIGREKRYDTEPEIRFHHQDYEKPIPEAADSFDLLLSLYAGFVSATCVRHLKVGGLLVANNSHGDASMASLDPRLEFIGAIHEKGNRYRLDTADLDRYLVPKRPMELSPDYLRRLGRGVAYTHPAQYYLFRRVN